MKLKEKTIGLIFSCILLIVISGCLAIRETRQTQAKQDNIIINCYCKSDIYDCDDFKTRQEARGVYECCMEKVGRDIHKLDGDLDGIACEL
ncbi:MAG: excalibur calcium-binding domain-containing protein [Patescibacteria group bacterium]|jgi:hypothetical protein